MKLPILIQSISFFYGHLSALYSDDSVRVSSHYVPAFTGDATCKLGLWPWIAEEKQRQNPLFSPDQDMGYYQLDDDDMDPEDTYLYLNLQHGSLPGVTPPSPKEWVKLRLEDDPIVYAANAHVYRLLPGWDIDDEERDERALVYIDPDADNEEGSDDNRYPGNRNRIQRRSTRRRPSVPSPVFRNADPELKFGISVCEVNCLDTRPDFHPERSNEGGLDENPLWIPSEERILNYRVPDRARPGEVKLIEGLVPDDEVKYHKVPYWFYCPPGRIARKSRKPWYMVPPDDPLTQPNFRETCECIDDESISTDYKPGIFKPGKSSCIESARAAEDGTIYIWIESAEQMLNWPDVDFKKLLNPLHTIEQKFEAPALVDKVSLWMKPDTFHPRASLQQDFGKGRLFQWDDLKKNQQVKACTYNPQEFDLMFQIFTAWPSHGNSKRAIIGW